MDNGTFKYCGPYNPQAIRQLFPNSHVADAPSGGGGGNQPMRQHPQQQQNMYANPYKMVQPDLLISGSDVPAGLPYPQVLHVDM
jgi:hypothetical protein